jgi:hypothetical protein
MRAPSTLRQKFNPARRIAVTLGMECVPDEQGIHPPEQSVADVHLVETSQREATVGKVSVHDVKRWIRARSELSRSRRRASVWWIGIVFRWTSGLP